MKLFNSYSLRIILLLFVLVPAILMAVQTTETAVIPGSIEIVPLERGRDDADEVLYEYGFEDGWGDWDHVDLTDPGTMWHTSETNAFDGNSWWCANEELGGYDDHWLQYMMTPVFSLAENADEACALTFKIYWAVEDPAGAEAPYDGWDGSNMWISTNGGEEWELLIPESPAYTSESLYSFGEEWGMGEDIPGWTGTSDGWLDAEIDLSAYAGQDNIQIRWAFCSDPSWHTGNPDDDPNGEAYGLLIDDITLTAGESVILTNNADDEGDEDEFSFDSGAISGDYWEITNEDNHRGDFSAHCPIEVDLQNALVSPQIELPEDWYIWFEFWVRADTKMANANPDEDNTLDDYFQVQVSTNGVAWQDVIYDYGSDDGHYLGYDNWTHYVPDLWFNNEYAEWRKKLNLTQFGGQTIQLRWKMISDDVMEGDQGTGVWIDDVEIFMSSRREYDAGVKWINIPFPNTVDISTRSQVCVQNNGLADLDQIRKYYQIDTERPNPIVPWEAMDADTFKVYPFTLSRIPYAGIVDLQVYTTAGNDEFTENDTMMLPDLLIYPPNIYLMGYDQRETQFRYTYDNGSGAAVLFTPEDDGMSEDDFDIKALHVQWNGSEENIDAQTTLHIKTDDNGAPGDDIYSTRLTIAQENLLPNMQVIDLSDVDELNDLNGNFWIWFELHSDDGSPQIVGNNMLLGQYFGGGHYFTFDGENLESLEDNRTNFMIRAVVMPSAVDRDAVDLVVGRDTLDYGVLEVRDRLTMSITFFNNGTDPVVIEDVVSGDRYFQTSLNFQPPTTLRVGEAVDMDVRFIPLAEGFFNTEITIDTDDETPPTIRLFGSTTNAAVNEDEVVPVEFSLGEAYPNPFNPTTTIPFSLPSAQKVMLTVHDLSGRLVSTITSGQFEAGSHTIVYDASELATGTYLYQLEAGSFKAVSKMVLVK